MPPSKTHRHRAHVFLQKFPVESPLVKKVGGHQFPGHDVHRPLEVALEEAVGEHAVGAGCHVVETLPFLESDESVLLDPRLLHPTDCPATRVV